MAYYYGLSSRHIIIIIIITLPPKLNRADYLMIVYPWFQAQRSPEKDAPSALTIPPGFAWTDLTATSSDDGASLG